MDQTPALVLEPPQRARQALALVALLAGVVYLTWRWGFTLELGSLWLGLPLLLAETWALTAAALFVFSTWRLTARTPGAPLEGSTVAVLIPTLAEPEEVLRPTVLGALAVRHEPRPVVWVLDDGDRTWVSEMCVELGAEYVARPAPRAHAKAGNLNHALEHVDAEFVLVLDADHVPLPHALERTLGYFANPRVAFVQGPQVFFNRGFQHPRDVEDPLLNEQSLFYDVICRGKDRHDATFWCGSSAVLRRAALVAVGGVATETVVEDTHTGMRLHAEGWESVYHHEVLAVGLAPEEVAAFLTQRGRWARGCFQLLRRDDPLFARGLDWRQRLHYFSSVSHYVEGPQRLIGLLVPSLVLLTGTLPLSAPPALYLGLFLPQLVLVPLATAAMARGRYRFLAGERFALVRAVAYTKASLAFFTRRPIAFAVTPKGSDAIGSEWLSAVRWQVAIAFLSILGIMWQTIAQLTDLPGRLTPFAYVVTVVWAGVSVVLIASVVQWAATVRHRRRVHRFPVRLEARYAVAYASPTARATVTDLSPFGLAFQPVTVDPALAEGVAIRVALDLGGRTVDVRGVVARIAAKDGLAAGNVGVRLDDMSPETSDDITRWCFSRPFGPDVPLVVGSDAMPPDRESAGDPVRRAA